MTKSNKFDYTNRSNSGIKLGEIIGKALEKEAEKVLNDVEKYNSKLRKESSSSNGSSGDSKDNVIHNVELRVPNKQLGDDGALKLAAGLEAALRRGTSVASLALVDLDLSGNSLTTASLARLAPIIELARFDLKSLNFSSNVITVRDDQEATEWETFLKAFRSCLKLRHLDFSHNRTLGSRALEILARIHANEPSIDPSPAAGEQSTHSLPLPEQENGTSEREVHEHRADEEDHVEDGKHHVLSRARHMKRRRGLRSIPYITLTDIGLNAAGALWLSYLLEHHHRPEQLISGLNAVPPDSPIRTYQQTTRSRGIDWDDDQCEISKAERSLLKQVEDVREDKMFNDAFCTFSIAEEENGVDGELHVPSHEVNGRGRKANGKTSLPLLDDHIVAELESSRKKMQRGVIEHDKLFSVELWRCALRTVDVARTLTKIASISVQRRSPTPATSQLNDIGKTFNDQCLPGHITKQIVCMVLPSRDREMLSTRQLDRAVRWGCDYKTSFAQQREWHSKAESAQALMLLECLGCVSYEEQSK